MGTLAAYVLAALIAWGATSSPSITVEFHDNPEAAIAMAGLGANGCAVDVYRGWWDGATEEHRQSVITHEVGHCLGLGHYGSCNHNPAIMGCAFLGQVTPYDRVMLAKAEGRAFTVTMPAVSAEPWPHHSNR